MRAIANLYQTVLEVERDGDRLQELFAFYIGLGLARVRGTARPSRVATRTCWRWAAGSRERPARRPVGLSAAEWQIAGRKIWNWGEKNQHIRDARVLARELLAEPDVVPLWSRRCAPCPRSGSRSSGHSFTMDLHWSSPSAFVPIVTAMLAAENPKVEVRQFQGGGLTSSRAYKNFYDDAVAWKPDMVLLVVLNRTDDDLASLRKMGEGFRAAGATGLRVRRRPRPRRRRPGQAAERGRRSRGRPGSRSSRWDAVLAASPDRARFFCLDKIHMTEPYHRLMAKEWLKFLVGARGAQPEG